MDKSPSEVELNLVHWLGRYFSVLQAYQEELHFTWPNNVPVGDVFPKLLAWEAGGAYMPPPHTQLSKDFGACANWCYRHPDAPAIMAGPPSVPDEAADGVVQVANLDAILSAATPQAAPPALLPLPPASAAFVAAGGASISAGVQLNNVSVGFANAGQPAAFSQGIASAGLAMPPGNAPSITPPSVPQDKQALEAWWSSVVRVATDAFPYFERAQSAAEGTFAVPPPIPAVPLQELPELVNFVLSKKPQMAATVVSPAQAHRHAPALSRTAEMPRFSGAQVTVDSVLGWLSNLELHIA